LFAQKKLDFADIASLGTLMCIIIRKFQSSPVANKYGEWIKKEKIYFLGEIE
jgi:hypothetical protein